MSPATAKTRIWLGYNESISRIIKISMNHLNPAKTGLALGGLVGGVHVVWTVLVLLGWAQPLVNFSQWAHMVSVPVVVQSFNLSAAVTVIIVAAAIGSVLGYAFAKIWNYSHQN